MFFYAKADEKGNIRVKPTTIRLPFAPGINFRHPVNKVAIILDPSSALLPEWTKKASTILHEKGLMPVLVKSVEETKKIDGIIGTLGPFKGGIDEKELHHAIRKIESNFMLQEPKSLNYLVLIDGINTNRTLISNISWALYYSKIHADYVTMDELDFISEGFLHQYVVVLLAGSLPKNIKVERFAQLLERYVNNGGGVVAINGIPPALYKIFGIKELGKTINIRSYACDGLWWQGAGDIIFRFDEDAGLAVDPVVFLDSNKIRIICHSKDSQGKDIPLAFSALYGKGRVVWWQGGMQMDKSGRGRLILSLLEAGEVGAVHVFGSLLFFVDDFPAPLWNEKIEPVASLYNKTHAEYYSELWWPSMHEMFETFVLKPTFAFMWSYDDKVSPPFDSNMWGKEEKSLDILLARRVKELGYEIGLHGYNHQSLTVQTCPFSKGWPSRTEMEEALISVKKGLAQIFGSWMLPKVYVAPHNLVQIGGKQAIRTVFPEITAISTVYVGEGEILPQEFYLDPDLLDVVDVPRISSGYVLDNMNIDEILDALVSPGVFSHFIHPDDIFDPDRSKGKDHEALMSDLHNMLKLVTSAYPFFQGITVSEFAEKVRQSINMKVETRITANSLNIKVHHGYSDGTIFLIRIPPGNEPSLKGCKILFQSKKMGRYYVKTTDQECAIGW